jgi:hypothetical protein
MRIHTNKLVVSIAVVLLAGVIAVADTPIGILFFPGSVIRWSILRETPLGSTDAAVRLNVEHRGGRFTVNRVHVQPNSEYPPSATGGESFATVVLGQYWMPFRTDVEAFYLFDGQGRLAGVEIRKTIDAL